MNIHLICLGKLKESYWRDAEAEYLKRLSPYYKIHIHELKEVGFSEKDNPENIKAKEAELIKEVLNKTKTELVIALDQHGKQYSSEDLASFLADKNDIALIIGGPLGLHDSIMQLVKFKISLSSLTFTHQMARIILWEQIYRAKTIQIGKKYHYW